MNRYEQLEYINHRPEPFECYTATDLWTDEYTSENVITGTSFEGTGVVPQIKVATDRALDAAVEDALGQPGSRH